ncbi:MAG: hypothetical protein ACXQTG_03450 [Methanoculleaceae archaeon]
MALETGKTGLTRRPSGAALLRSSKTLNADSTFLPPQVTVWQASVWSPAGGATGGVVGVTYRAVEAKARVTPGHSMPAAEPV